MLHRNRGDCDGLLAIRRAKDDSRSDITRHRGGIKVWSGLRRTTIRLIVDDIVKGTACLRLFFGRRRRRLAQLICAKVEQELYARTHRGRSVISQSIGIFLTARAEERAKETCKQE